MSMFMERYSSQTYALLRIITGFIFLWHGSQKLLGFPVAMSYQPPAYILYIVGPIELIGGVLVMIGLFARWTAFICSGLMAFAYWMAHGSKTFWPILNGGELAVLFCFLFLFIASNGSGIWSVDKARS